MWASSTPATTTPKKKKNEGWVNGGKKQGVAFTVNLQGVGYLNQTAADPPRPTTASGSVRRSNVRAFGKPESTTSSFFRNTPAVNQFFEAQRGVETARTTVQRSFSHLHLNKATKHLLDNKTSERTHQSNRIDQIGRDLQDEEDGRASLIATDRPTLNGVRRGQSASRLTSSRQSRGNKASVFPQGSIDEKDEKYRQLAQESETCRAQMPARGSPQRKQQRMTNMTLLPIRRRSPFHPELTRVVKSINNQDQKTTKRFKSNILDFEVEMIEKRDHVANFVSEEKQKMARLDIYRDLLDQLIESDMSCGHLLMQIRDEFDKHLPPRNDRVTSNDDTTTTTLHLSTLSDTNEVLALKHQNAVLKNETSRLTERIHEIRAEFVRGVLDHSSFDDLATKESEEEECLYPTLEDDQREENEFASRPNISVPTLRINHLDKDPTEEEEEEKATEEQPSFDAMFEETERQEHF